MARYVFLILFFISCSSTKEVNFDFKGYPQFIKGHSSPLMINIHSKNMKYEKVIAKVKESFSKKIVNDLEWVVHEEQLTPGRMYIEINLLNLEGQYDRPYWRANTEVKVTVIDHRNKDKINKKFKVFRGSSKVFGLSDESDKFLSLNKSWNIISKDIINFLSL
ncbi:MAG: hypothetical protein OEY33_04925 [Bdellovibrionales bacterium]|nr:hypothetical protein [Bdellovibrionales bacterium]